MNCSEKNDHAEDVEVAGPVQTAAVSKLRAEINPQHLEVINEGPLHNAPKGTEAYFKVIIVSEKFDGKPLLQRHRMVQAVLRDELDSGAIHALTIVAKTPVQWQTSSNAS